MKGARPLWPFRPFTPGYFKPFAIALRLRSIAKGSQHTDVAQRFPEIRDTDLSQNAFRRKKHASPSMLKPWRIPLSPEQTHEDRWLLPSRSSASPPVPRLQHGGLRLMAGEWRFFCLEISRGCGGWPAKGERGESSPKSASFQKKHGKRKGAPFERASILSRQPQPGFYTEVSNREGFKPDGHSSLWCLSQRGYAMGKVNTGLTETCVPRFISPELFRLNYFSARQPMSDRLKPSGQSI